MLTSYCISASSRSSFLELIGIRKKKDSCTEKKNSFGKQIFKKRKRKASESDSLQSNDEERCNGKCLLQKREKTN